MSGTFPLLFPVWDDIRTNSTVDKVLARIPDQNRNHFRQISGLPISPYFSALKLCWLKENVPAVRRACREKRCYAGTIDTWLIWVRLEQTTTSVEIFVMKGTRQQVSLVFTS